MGLTQVNSEGIKDGEIKETAVNASAAIAGSKLAAATTSAAGSMSAADKTKLDGVATSATANPSAPALTGSTNNQITTVTGANAIQGEANLTFDGSTFAATGISHFNVAETEVDIKSTGSGSKHSLRLLNSDASADNKIGIYFGPANNVAGASIQGVAESDFTTTANRDGGLIFTTRKDGNWLERMRIAANGTVSKIYQPCSMYKALSNAATNFATDSTETLVFSGMKRNEGSHYDTSNGRFTAPVAGTYFVGHNCLIDNDSGDVARYADLQVNGSGYVTLWYDESGGDNDYHGVSGTAIVELSANDFIQIRATAGIHTGSETSFSVYLLG